MGGEARNSSAGGEGIGPQRGRAEEIVPIPDVLNAAKGSVFVFRSNEKNDTLCC
jgi:hypothetical protein